MYRSMAPLSSLFISESFFLCIYRMEIPQVVSALRELSLSCQSLTDLLLSLSFVFYISVDSASPVMIVRLYHWLILY